MSGPFRNAFLQAVPTLEESNRVVTRPRAQVAQRSAGVPILRPISAPQSLLTTADFSSRAQGSPQAFWMIGRDLFQAQSNQILRDARTAIQVPSETPFLYPFGIFERMATAARRRNPAVTLPPLPDSDFSSTFSDDWLKVLLWLTYSDAPVRLADVRLPLQTILPETGDGDSPWVAPGSAGASSVAVSRGFDPALLAQNPFSTYYGEEIPVEGAPPDVPPGASSSSSSSGAGLVVGLGLAALLLLSGGKK